jgi:MFS family permease
MGMSTAVQPHEGTSAPFRAAERTRLRVGVMPLLVAVMIAAGVALRVFFLASSLGSLDSDEAVWGLMAQHTLHGHLAVFYWGQHYGGTQETFLTALGFAVFGSSTLALKIVPTVLWAVAAVLVWRVGLRTLGGRAAAFAAGLFWVWPTFSVFKSTRAHGFYGVGLVLGLATLLLALRLRERDSRVDYALLGLVLGLGWWATPQFAILALPALLWLVWRRPRALRYAWLVALTSVIGALPWLVDNLQHGWASLHFVRDETSNVGHLHNLAVATLPTGLGFRLPYSLAWLPDVWVGGVAYVALLAGFGWLLVCRRDRLEPLLLAGLIFPLLYVSSPYTWLNTEPRYLTLMMPVFALLLAAAATSPARAAAVFAVALAFSVAGAIEMQRHNLAAAHADGGVVPVSVQPVLRILRAHHVDRVYASYWVAYRITFESKERIISAKTGQDHYEVRHGELVPIDAEQGRYPAYNRIVQRSRGAADVFVDGGSVEPRLREDFLALGYRRIVTGGWIVYLPRSTW